MLNKKSVDDINVKGKRVLVRCDFNVPLIDGKITDENRLVAALPTIKKLIADGGKIILCSHLGKPKGQPVPELSLAPVAARLSELLGQEVKFAADPEVVGPNAKAAVEAMQDGDVILLENTRYRAEETKNGEEFSKELASLCDVFVNERLWNRAPRTLLQRRRNPVRRYCCSRISDAERDRFPRKCGKQSGETFCGDPGRSKGFQQDLRDRKPA